MDEFRRHVPASYITKDYDIDKNGNIESFELILDGIPTRVTYGIGRPIHNINSHYQTI